MYFRSDNRPGKIHLDSTILKLGHWGMEACHLYGPIVQTRIQSSMDRQTQNPAEKGTQYKGKSFRVEKVALQETSPLSI